jgi:hypothetical protein
MPWASLAASVRLGERQMFRRCLIVLSVLLVSACGNQQEEEAKRIAIRDNLERNGHITYVKTENNFNDSGLNRIELCFTWSSHMVSMGEKYIFYFEPGEKIPAQTSTDVFSGCHRED